MYYLGLPLYTDKQVLDAAITHFGGILNFGTYFVIRFFILLQILNSAFNYAQLFAVLPLLKTIKPLKLKRIKGRTLQKRKFRPLSRRSR